MEPENDDDGIMDTGSLNELSILILFSVIHHASMLNPGGKGQQPVTPAKHHQILKTTIIAAFQASRSAHPMSDLIA